MQNLKFKMEFWLGLLFSRPGQLHHTSWFSDSVTKSNLLVIYE
jgi:hypothetical protein